MTTMFSNTKQETLADGSPRYAGRDFPASSAIRRVRFDYLTNKLLVTFVGEENRGVYEFVVPSELFDSFMLEVSNGASVGATFKSVFRGHRHTKKIE
jgi:hypothetical protein